jgi:hypothetical protein
MDFKHIWVYFVAIAMPAFGMVAKVNGPKENQHVLSLFENELNAHLNKTPVDNEEDSFKIFLESISSSEIFWASLWEKIPFKISANYSSIYSFEDEKHLFSKRCLTVGPSNIQIVDERVAVGDVHSFMADGSLTNSEFSSGDSLEYILDRLSNTGTVVIDSAESVDPKVSNVSRAFASSFGIPFAGINVYTTKLGQDVAAPLVSFFFLTHIDSNTKTRCS